jgi:hypothetical protein
MVVGIFQLHLFLVVGLERRLGDDKKRLAWAKKYLAFAKRHKSDVLFIDEKIFDSLDSD